MHIPFIGCLWLLIGVPVLASGHAHRTTPSHSLERHNRIKHAEVANSRLRQHIAPKVPIVIEGAALKTSDAPLPTMPEQQGKETELQCLALHVFTSSSSLPLLNGSAVISLHNPSEFSIKISHAGLIFNAVDKRVKGGQRNVTRQIYIEAANSNPQIVLPGQDVQLKFLLQLFQDAPQDPIQINPQVTWSYDVSNLSARMGQNADALGKQLHAIIASVPDTQLHQLQTIASAQPATLVVDRGVSLNSSVVFLGDDRPDPGTGGDWLGRYGNASFILCGLAAPQDIVGGPYLPRMRWKQGQGGFGPTTPVWSDWKGEFFYDNSTGEGQDTRHWMDPHNGSTDDPRALINPSEGGRRFPSWDDQGETRPYDAPGPDLIAHLEVPAGLWRLTFYFIDWDHYGEEKPRVLRFALYDVSHKEDISNKLGPDGFLENNQLASSGYASDLKEGVYKVYGVQGPVKLRLRVQKVHSINAVLSGIFLDHIQLQDIQHANPPPVEDQTADLSRAMQLYNELQYLSQTDASKFLRSATKMQELYDLTSQTLRTKDAVKNTEQDHRPRPLAEARTAEWLRWQCTSSLVVKPTARTGAFTSYLVMHPSQTTEAARQRVQVLLETGDVGLARIAVEPWLILAKHDGSVTKLAALREAIKWFCKRDTNFACTLADQFSGEAKNSGNRPDVVVEEAQQIRNIAQLDYSGPLHTQVVNRVTLALYKACIKDFGVEASGDEVSYHLAETTQEVPGYHLSSEKAGIKAYLQYIRQWPSGKYVVQAHWNVICLAGPVAAVDPSFADIAANSAEVLIQKKSQSSQDIMMESQQTFTPASVAQCVSSIYRSIDNIQQAKKWEKKADNMKNITVN